jgi:ATP-dependent RNA helicase SUPV3L1/SUV3
MHAPPGQAISALLGPTNTGKTHQAIERMLEHESGIIGLPLRLLAREVYDRITARIGERNVALVTGEEKRVPPSARYWVCTVEAMPVDRTVDFLAVDEIQLAAHRERGHVFTDRLLNARGRLETWFMGADTMVPLLEHLVPTATLRRRPRFSELGARSTVSLSALMPRSAIVAFSASRVYELAERIRARRGGAAIVLGALSPRARNKQVALYQSGDVDYMVATDAIGMGLNLDVDHVAFADIRKFDGRHYRELDAPELAQIAGRAGRHQNNGTFGTLAPLPPLPDHVVRAIELHRFSPERRLVWRNSDLDLDSVEALLASLRVPPKRSCLRLIERAEDHEALLELTSRSQVKERTRGSEAVSLLWQVCQIPDFAQLLFHAHANLLEEVFLRLVDGKKLDADFMHERMQRLSDPAADIDTLLARMARIRTFTYITHRADWVDNAPHWQAVALSIEDRLSDSLHDKLVARFVDKASGKRRPARRSAVRQSPAALDESTVKVGPFAALHALHEKLSRSACPVGASEDWLDAAIEARHEELLLDSEGRIFYEERQVGVLVAGRDLLSPSATPVLERDGRGGDRLRLQRRLSAWARDLVSEVLEPMRALPEEALSPALRGLVYQLEQGLGTVSTVEARGQLNALSDRELSLLVHGGFVIGRHLVYAKRLLTKGMIARRAALLRAYVGGSRVPALSASPSASIRVRPGPERQDLLRVGYAPFGPMALRADVAERVASALEELSGATEFSVPRNVQSLLGCRRSELPHVLRAFGYRPAARGVYVAEHVHRQRKSERASRRGAPTPGLA